jgi:hypothetical protein
VTTDDVTTDAMTTDAMTTDDVFIWPFHRADRPDHGRFARNDSLQRIRIDRDMRIIVKNQLNCLANSCEHIRVFFGTPLIHRFIFVANL